MLSFGKILWGGYMYSNKIIIKGARENNLKNVDLELPKNSLIVFTGLSGSGKSTLAFNTIYSEGQRRYVESLSSYARQFLGGVEKPDVDSIDGLSPSIAIDQSTKEAFRLGELSMTALKNGFDMLIARDYERRHKLREDIQHIQSLNEELLSYLVKISSTCKLDTQEQEIARLHKIINDFYRLVEIADNMIGYTKNIINNEIVFSDKVIQELTVCMSKLEEQFNNLSSLNSASHYKTKNKIIEQINKCEDSIDNLRSVMIKEHITRLENNECLPKSSGVFINLISNLERAGDHLFFVSESMIEKNQNK